MSTLAELKQRLEAARVEREQRERETREQEERELQRLVEEERREEEECARREQQRADEEKKWADEGRVAEEQQNTMDVGGEGSKEMEDTAGVTETAGESWETDIARLHAAAMAGGTKDGEEEYQATEDTCWNCRHQKLVCERLE